MSLFSQKARQIVRGQREAWKRLESASWQGPVVWFHVAASSRLEQAKPLMARLKKEHPEKQVLLTFGAYEDYEKHQDFAQADLTLFLPFATRRNAKRFVKTMAVETAVFVQDAILPAYLLWLQKSEVPAYLADALFDEKQAKQYRRALERFSLLFVQDEASREVLEKNGIDKVVVAGNTLVDCVAERCAKPQALPVMERFTEEEVSPLMVVQTAHKQTIVAGSTWPEDEVLLQQYVASHPEVQLVMAPQDISEEHLHYIFNLFQGRYVRYSQSTPKNLSVCRVLLVDNEGTLASIYPYAAAAYVGGGMGRGVHNVLEPAVFGLPIVMGPNLGGKREARDLQEKGGAFVVNDYAELEAAIDNALRDSKTIGHISKEYIHSELGATERIFNAIWHK